MSSSHYHIACACVPEELFIPPGSNDLSAAVIGRLGTDLKPEGELLKVALDGRLAVAVAAAPSSTYLDEDSKFMVAFTGSLDADAMVELGRTYLEGRAEGTFTCAELVCAMYRVHQPLQVTSRLKGDWALVGFDIMQMRAFGARSCKEISLYQGKLLNGTIVLSTFDLAKDSSLPLEWKVELTEVPVAHYVFGWRKLQLPIPFHRASDADPPQTHEAAASAAMAALKGLPRLSIDGNDANRRQSLDVVSAPRGGEWTKNKQGGGSRRQSLDGRRTGRTSMDRTSMDGRRSVRQSIDEQRPVRQSIDEQRPMLNLAPIDDARKKQLEERRSTEIRRSMEQNSALFAPSTAAATTTTKLAPTAAPFQPAASCATEIAKKNVEVAMKSSFFGLL